MKAPRMVRTRAGLFALAVGAGLLTWSLHAASVPSVVTPDNVERAFRNAEPGQKIVLEPGDYGALTVPRGTYAPRLKIDASQARFSSVVLRYVDGVDFSGGSVVGEPSDLSAVTVDHSSNVRIQGMKLSGSRIGVTVARSEDIAVVGNRLDGIRSDGVNVTMARRVRIEGNVCDNFHPIPSVYDAKGTLLKDGDHPDCVQGWTTPGTDPTADITIVGNEARGYMQGIFFGNPGQGGYDRLIVRDNLLTLSAFNGIVIWETRDSEIAHNVVRPEKGARMRSYPFQLVSPWVKISGEGNRVCGNRVERPSFSDGTEPC